MKNWLSLRISILPYLSIEINNAYEHYFDLIDEIRRTEEKEKIKEFKNFQLEITKRIKELETFYEDNISDSLIFLVENAKVKLKKMLMYNVDVLTKIENNLNNELNSNLNCTNTKYEDYKSNPKTFDSPSKINFGSGFGTNQTNFKNGLEHGGSSGNLFNTNKQGQQFLSGQNSQNNLNQNNNNKINNHFNPMSEAKNKNQKSNLHNSTNKTKTNKTNEHHKGNNLNQNNSSPLLISNKILGSTDRSKNYVNLEPKTKNKLGKAELRRSHSQTGKEIIAKRMHKINLDNLNLGKNQEFSLLEFRNNYLDQEGNFMPLKHIAFKIKLTENEYRLLMKERNKKI